MSKAINLLKIASTINELPGVIQPIFQQVSKASGWSFTLLMGGPRSEGGGHIISEAHHMGTTILGHNFGTTFCGFQDKIVMPYQAFLRQVYCMSFHLF